MRTTIAAVMTRVEVNRPRARPPSSRGFVSVSPSVAPRGRVKTYAAQKRRFAGTRVTKWATAMSAMSPANTSAPSSNPSPVVVALRLDLQRDRQPEEREKTQRAHGIAEVQCHRQRIAAGLSDGRRADLHNPEGERDARHLALDGVVGRHYRGCTGVTYKVRVN